MKNMKLRERQGEKKKKRQYLDRSLTPEQLVFTKVICWAQKHIDHDVVKVRLAPLAPFQDDEKREVPKQGIQKQKLWDELIPGKKTDTQRVCQEKIH